MKWQDIPAGNYLAKISDWGIEQVDKLGGIEKAVIQFDVHVTPVDMVSGRWEGFLLTKEGKPNGKTMKTLIVCGFHSDEIYDLAIKNDSLDNSKDYDVTIIKDGQYTRIEWVNLPGAGAGIKKIKPAKKSSAAFKAALRAAREDMGAKPKVKNYADDVGPAGEELGF